MASLFFTSVRPEHDRRGELLDLQVPAFRFRFSEDTVVSLAGPVGIGCEIAICDVLRGDLRAELNFLCLGIDALC